MVVNSLQQPGLPLFLKPPAAAGTSVAPADAFAGPSNPASRPSPMEKAALHRLFDTPNSLGVQPGGTRQMADYDGRVRHLALMLSSYVNGQDRDQVLNAYKVLFTEMEPDTKFTVVVDDDQDKEDVQRIIAENNVPNPERIQLLTPPVNDLTVWARDMMVGLEFPGSPERNAVMGQQPLHDWHGNDKQVPIYLSQSYPGLLLNPAPRLVTDGGDTTSNRETSFVGYYSIAATSERLADACSDPEVKASAIKYFQAVTGKTVIPSGGLSYQVARKEVGDLHRVPFDLVRKPGFSEPHPGPNEATEQEMYEWLTVKMFERELGKPVTVLGKDDPNTEHHEEPATDHMDMGFTPIGDHQVLVGDPELAKKLIESMTPAERKQAEERFSQLAGKPVSLEDYFGPQVANRDTPEDFAAYVRTAESKGYQVARLPHLEPSMGMPYISYNNCLMERFHKDGQEVKRVFLPVYGVEKLDSYAQDVWSKQGFEVHPMQLDALSAKWGALRCISNWMERSPT